MTPDTDEAAKPPRRIAGRPPIQGHALTVLALLAAGAGFTAWGISDAPAADRRRDPPAIADSRTSSACSDADLLRRGAQLQQRQCAGCHAPDERLVGPAFADIVSRYAGAPDGRSAMAAAMLHPSPGVANYPPASAQPDVSSVDRDAIACWILGLSHDAR